jgi:hypothetical protein
MLGDFTQHEEILEARSQRRQGLGLAFDRIDTTDDLARRVLVIPELRRGGLLFQRFQFGFQLRDVKDTSGALRGGPSGSRCRRLAYQ